MVTSDKPCKVAYDVCSICGNKAKRPTDYCSHIRLEKKKIYPDGKQAYMINYNPTFFDISIVRRRADRIAYVLSKVASEQKNLNDLKADSFDEMLSAIPEVEEPVTYEIKDQIADDIFTLQGTEGLQKAASVEDLAKIAMIKRINAEAVRVMNNGVRKVIPVLEQVEPDLPVSLLDELAMRYSFPDILKSFFVNAIPMKPREATRIIIIQNGISPKMFDRVHEIVSTARPAGDIADIGQYHSMIGAALRPFLMARSSFLPAVMQRIERVVPVLKTASATLNVDIPNAHWAMNPALNYGMVRRPEGYTSLAGDPKIAPTLPNSGRYYQEAMAVAGRPIEMAHARPKLKDPTLGPVATAATLGALYAAYRSSDFVKAALANPKTLALMAAIAAIVHASAKAPSLNDMMAKQASLKGDTAVTAATFGLPFIGAHFMSAHYRNKYDHGYNLNAGERFVAENPDVLSIAAPLAVNYALMKYKPLGNTNPFKFASAQDADEAFYEKLATIGDVIADVGDNVMAGLVFGSKNRSLLSMTIDNQIDNTIMSQLSSKNKPISLNKDQQV